VINVKNTLFALSSLFSAYKVVFENVLFTSAVSPDIIYGVNVDVSDKLKNFYEHRATARVLKQR
jgi:hypothetical protein